jgi:LysM repeat protein
MAIDPSQIIDFETGKPHDDLYTFRKRIDNYGRVYTSTSEHFVYHRVKEGETLGAIARRYHTSVDELCHLNGLKRTSTLRIGQSIRCGVEYTKPKPTESPGASGTINNNVIEEPEIVQRPASYHTVQSGETLSSIARQHGTTVSNICRLNDILSTDRLRIGQILCYRAEAKKPVKKPMQESVQTKESVSTKYQSVSSTPEMLASSEELNGESDHEDEYEHDIYDDAENADNQEDTGDAIASTENSTEVAPATKTTSESAKSEGMVLVQRPVFVATAKPAPERKPKSSPRLFQKSDPSKSNTAKDSQSIDNEDTTSSESTETGDPSESIINQESSVDKQDDQSGETASAAVSEEPKSVAAQNVKAEPQSPVYHVIKKGDTLEKIARRYGVSIKRICKINNITTTTTLRIGRSLRCS